MPDIAQDENERPLPTRGIHWSLAHRPTMVAGVTSIEPIAIDVERIRPRERYQIEAVLSLEERNLLGGDAVNAYFCAWVAKAAVRRLIGVDLTRLSRTRIVEAWSNGALVRYDQVDYPVAFEFLVGHVAAVTGHSSDVEWRFFPENTPAELYSPSEAPSMFM